MIYLERIPNPLLRSSVQKLWYCRAPQMAHRYERVLPHGCMQITVNLRRDSLLEPDEEEGTARRLPGAIIAGTRARYGILDTANMEELAGIAFQPGGFAGLFRERADLFFDQTVALNDVWARSCLAERLNEVSGPAGKLCALESLLTQLLQKGRPRPECVGHAVHLLRDRALSVNECARAVGISERRLSQVFREHVGMGPKMWSRIQRFQAALRALRRGTDMPWPELALECGYYDQSHFANDFRAFSGINPMTYVATRVLWQNHVPIHTSDFSKTSHRRQ